MNYIIPFEKTIDFGCQVREICSISLEHEITKNDTEVLGNFLLKGTYKEHELSVNTSDFNFTVPFCVEIAKDIDLSTLEVSIDNFTYELNNNGLDIKIDYYVNADEIRHEEEVDEDEDLLDLIEEVGEKEGQEEIKNDTQEVRNEEIITEEIAKEIPSMQTDTDYITYQIHVVKSEETIESISAKYSVDPLEIKDINNIDSIMVNDKLIIPIKDE